MFTEREEGKKVCEVSYGDDLAEGEVDVCAGGGGAQEGKAVA